MQLLVAYDVCTEKTEGQRRLRKIASICLDFGQRVQKSVFECSISEMDYERLKHRLLECMNHSEDSLRIYRLQTPKAKYIEHFGINQPVDFEAPLVL